jgi:hypothetical protein
VRNFIKILLGPSHVFQFDHFNVIGPDRVANQAALWLGMNTTQIQAIQVHDW